MSSGEARKSEGAGGRRPSDPAADAARREGGLARRWRERISTVPSQGVPVWVWQSLMHAVSRHERRRFNADPIAGVHYHLDIDYVGDGIPAHHLDVIAPMRHGQVDTGSLPVYVYFHGGGWTSGDKSAVTKYCASQAIAGMVVVNANYRRATRVHMGQILEDASAVVHWVTRTVAHFGGDPASIVLGGDSAGGQIAALLTAASLNDVLSTHHGLVAAPAPGLVKGLVQHCSIVDFSVLFERGSVLSLDFVRMLVPHRRRLRGKGASASRGWLHREARFLSPIEWLAPGFPPVFVTTSRRDYFYRANMNFLQRLHRERIPVDSMVYGWSARRTGHTWQQDPSLAESQEVYRRLQRFVRRVTRTSTRGAP